MKTALITGVAGQDGSYMAELLLDKGYRVVGGVRDLARAAKSLPPRLRDGVELVLWDMCSQETMTRVLSTIRPCEIYNFAAFSSGAGMYDDPVGMAEVNGVAVARTLEAIRQVDTGIRFCQASSREVFGEALSSPQNESTPRNPRSPYGAAKAFADSLVQIYRQRYGMFATSAILFNHESPRRGLSFVTRKISHEAARIKLGLATELLLGNLEAERDWGFAADYVHAMWLMQQQAEPDDYVISTGKGHSVREFCEYAFAHLGLDYRVYVREDRNSYRPAEPVPLIGCSEKARAKLGWNPTTRFRELVGWMVDADMQMLDGNKTVKAIEDV
jgi:GDPmannose 4,6-dehydratase